MKNRSQWILALLLSSSAMQGMSKVTTISDLMDRLETDVKAFSKIVQSIVVTPSSSSGSNTDLCSDCLGRNYHHCISQYPSNNANCFDTFTIDPNVTSPCYNNYRCSSRLDYSASTVRLSRDIQYLQDDNKKIAIFESICRTVPLDDKFREYFTNNTLGIRPLAIHYGTRDGMQRIYPARQSEDDEFGVCNEYDPRTRPSYTGATTYQRKIILILDISLSNDGNRMENMKQSVQRIISSATIADYLAIITYNSTDIRILEISTDSPNIDGFYSATISTKDALGQWVQNLQPPTSSSTSSFTKNYTAVFQSVIQLINTTASSIGCSTAVLFFTDKVTEPKGVIESSTIQNQFEILENQTDNTILLFVYLLDLEDIKDETIFTCNGEKFRMGIWSTIVDPNKDIVPGLSNFFEVFQVAFEQQQKQQQKQGIDNLQVAWSEPYPFYSFGVEGTTVSVAVYDANGRVMGVVGIGYPLNVLLQEASGDVRTEIRTRAQNQQSGFCPNFNNLSPCVFHYNSRSTTNVLCSPSRTTNNNVSSSSNMTTTNTTSTTTIDKCPNIDYTVSSMLSSLITTDDHSSTLSKKYCCGSTPNADATTVDCTDLSSTSKLWNNTLYELETYAVRGCCTTNATATSMTLSIVSNQMNLDGLCIMGGIGLINTSDDSVILDNSSDTNTSTPPPSFELTRTRTTAQPTSAPTPTSATSISDESKTSNGAVSPGAITGFVLGSIVLAFIIFLVVYCRKTSSSINITDRPNEHPPSYRKEPLQLRPRVPFMDE